MKETSFEDVVAAEKRKRQEEEKERSRLNKEKRERFKKKFELKKKKGCREFLYRLHELWLELLLVNNEKLPLNLNAVD